MNLEVSLGASYVGEGRCHFCVWAPSISMIEVHVVSPIERIAPLARHDLGYHAGILKGIEPGALYLYRLDGEMERPDPVSRFQPQGVHGPSQVIDPFFPWADQGWPGHRLRDYIIYELHVGTFTPEGTFEATTDRLDALKDLGVTAVEIMPVAQFPGERNWGYDGVYPFAVQNSYGGPEGLKRFVNACHRRELAVVLDVVYNHLGPEGNYLMHYGPYFTDRYRTPWGASLNFDGPHSDEVRRFLIENALYWIQDYHVDALRLDAVHAILDFSAQPFLEELAMVVHAQADRLNRRVYLIAESALNDTRIIRSRDLGGFGIDAQWNDDFHHALHTLLTGEKDGYYQDFGRLSHLQKAFREGFVYSGQYSTYRGRRHGNSSLQIPVDRFVVFAQNHDQIGNRMLGERLSQLIPFEGLKLAAGTVVLSPFIALLFMGEEYGETAPFPYFTSHSDTDLVKAVRRGRREEFAPFKWQGDPFDPQDEATFLRAKLNQNLARHGHHRYLFDFHQELIRLRKELPIIASSDKEQMEALRYEKERVLLLRRRSDTSEAVSVYHFSDNSASVSVFMPQGRWQKRLDSAEERWQGPGSQIPMEIISEGFVTLALSAYSVLLFTRERNA